MNNKSLFLWQSIKKNMELDLLTLLIKSACSDGIVTPAEKEFLHENAKKISVSDEVLEFLIKTELERLQKEKNTTENTNSGINYQASGFISNSGVSTSSNNQSGFETKGIDDQNHDLSGFIGSDQSGASIKAGKTIGEFTEVVDLQAQGAMSLVQKAKYFGKWVIVKRLKPEFRNNKKYQGLISREFENCYFLDHPNIIRINGKGQDAEGFYYFMEYVDGQTLSGLITSKGIKDGGLILKIALEILDALEYVHKKQVFHRDLKPENILVTYKGDNVKLIDFGLAQADSYEDDLVTVGTPKYAAPEQKNKGNQVDARADIYSFGIILLEMLTGQIESVEHVKSRTISSYLIIKKCLEIEPSRRYQNCNQIREDLKNVNIKDLIHVEEIRTTRESEYKETATDQPEIKIKTFEASKRLCPYIQTANEFFRFTHEIWKSGKLSNLDLFYSKQPTYKQRAESLSAYEILLNETNENIFFKFIKNNHFIEGEYLLINDKRSLFLTNYRILLKSADSDKFELIPLSQISANKPVSVVDNIYVIFDKYKIWKSDWEIAKKVINLKEWEKQPENIQRLIWLNKTSIENYIESVDSEFDPLKYLFNADSYPHTQVDDLVSKTIKKWHSQEMAGYFNNKYLNLSPIILESKPIIETIFSNYIPLKGEYYFIDRFHNGIITNYRLFYFNENQQKYDVVAINKVKNYGLNKSGTLLVKEEVIVQKTDGTNLKLKLIESAYSQKYQSEVIVFRINQLVQRNEMQYLSPKVQELIESDKNITCEWFNLL